MNHGSKFCNKQYDLFFIKLQFPFQFEEMHIFFYICM